MSYDAATGAYEQPALAVPMTLRSDPGVARMDVRQY